MNGERNEDLERPKRRGYHVPEARDPKRSRGGRRRGDETDYYGPSAGDDHHDLLQSGGVSATMGWECMECQSWNQARDVECRGCGLHVDCAVQKQDDDLDEFGRRRPPPGPPAPRWPPDFDTHGSDYVLDTRSGMFYEAKSNFFYDPTTKLYYSHEKQAYFRHRVNNKGKSTFDMVDNKAEDASGSGEGVHSNSSDLRVIQPAISINLKTKALSKKPKKKKVESMNESKSSTTTTGSLSVPPKKNKEHEADLAKWSERQSELKEETRDLKNIPKTAKGEPICTLCQRKFATLSKLLYHEQKSELHKSNLAKKKISPVEKEIPVSPKEEAKLYVDRAEQRRLMHGPDTSPVPTGRQVEDSPAATTTPKDPKETLNDSNIGNKMLQKLGWEQGKGLGRRPGRATNELEQDWERIERLAAANAFGRK